MTGGHGFGDGKFSVMVLCTEFQVGVRVALFYGIAGVAFVKSLARFAIRVCHVARGAKWHVVKVVVVLRLGLVWVGGHFGSLVCRSS